MKSLNYFVSTFGVTKDARIFANLAGQYGPWLEKLDGESKLVLRAVLAYYVYFKKFRVSEYLIVDAIADVLPDCSSCNLLLGLQGLSDESCEILIKLVTAQQFNRSIPD